MKICVNGLDAKARQERKKAGSTAIHAAKIRKPAAKSVAHAEDQAEKNVLSTHHVAQPLPHAAKEANGAKNLRKEKKDEHKTY